MRKISIVDNLSRKEREEVARIYLQMNTSIIRKLMAHWIPFPDTADDEINYLEELYKK